jgi:hypothetical protein
MDEIKSKGLAQLILYPLFALGVIFSLFAPRFSQLIESGYSTKLYFWTIRHYSLLTGLFPFSLAEITVVCTIAFMIPLQKEGIYLLLLLHLKFKLEPLSIIIIHFRFPD